MHVLDRPETRQFLAEPHQLPGRLLRPASVHLEDLRVREVFVLLARQGTLAIGRALVLVRLLQTGPFEEVCLGVRCSFLVRFRAAAGDLIRRDGHDLPGICLRGCLELNAEY